MCKLKIKVLALAFQSCSVNRHTHRQSELTKIIICTQKWFVFRINCSHVILVEPIKVLKKTDYNATGSLLGRGYYAVSIVFLFHCSFLKEMNIPAKQTL